MWAQLADHKEKAFEQLSTSTEKTAANPIAVFPRQCVLILLPPLLSEARFVTTIPMMPPISGTMKVIASARAISFRE